MSNLLTQIFIDMAYIELLSPIHYVPGKAQYAKINKRCLDKNKKKEFLNQNKAP